MKRKLNSCSAVLATVLLSLFLSAEKACAEFLPYTDEPLFQYAVFYNINLEIDPSADMPIEGPVFSNAGIWTGTYNVIYTSTVEAAGQVNTNAVDPFCVGKVDGNDSGTPQSSFLYPGQPVSGLIPMTFLPGGPGITNAEAIINLPPPAVGAPQSIAYEPTNQMYDFNAASLIVSNWWWGTNGVAPWSNNFTVYAQDTLLNPVNFQNNGMATNWIQLTNDYYVISNRYLSVTNLIITNRIPNSYFRFTNNWLGITWTNTAAQSLTNGPIGTNYVWYAGFSFLTNVSYYDYREKATAQAVQLDVGKLGAWITNSALNGGSNWNQELCADEDHGFNSIYIYNAVPQIGQSVLPAVRVVHGALLPYSICDVSGLPVFTSGLTVVTPQPLYVEGNYNTQIAGSAGSSAGTHNVVYTYPAALMADSITVLSTNWNDSFNIATALTSRVPITTTVNAACFEGIVPSVNTSTITNYSGGLENFLRTEENWNGVALWYNGSIAVMFPSQYATNFWPGTGAVYDPPVRDWAFDTNFLNDDYIPALTPTLVNSNPVPAIISQPTNQTVLAGSTVTFSVTVTNFSWAFSYQWQFNREDVGGNSNTLVLTNVSAANAGNYSVVVNDGLVDRETSSNAVLSVYPSAVPTMNLVSCSTTNGIQFTVSGVPGFNYAVETSTNLLDWTPLTTNNSPFTFTDTNVYCPQRFYRSVYLP